MAETTDPTAIDIIVDRVGEQDPTDTHRVTVDGVKVDVIDTVPVAGADLEELDDTNQLFLVSHRWALDSAELTTIEVIDGPSATVRLAVPAGLVAAKTHALATRRDIRADKRASDAYDVYRLLEAYDRDQALTRALAEAPLGLGRLVGRHLGQLLVDDAERAVRWMALGSADMRAVSPQDLRDAAGPLCDVLG